MRLDPAASAKTSIGPAVFYEYARVFGERITDRWPVHPVIDGLDQIEVMLGSAPSEPRILIHPRCIHLIHAFQNYRRAERDGDQRQLEFPMTTTRIPHRIPSNDN